MTTIVLFVLVAGVIVAGGTQLARYGDVIGEKSGLGRNWIGMILLAATTSLPELFTGFSATALNHLPNIASGDVLGSCLFNLLILSLMDVIYPERISARAHQGHVLTIGLGAALMGVVGLGMAAAPAWPTVAGAGLYSFVLIGGYLAAARMAFLHEVKRRAAIAAAETIELQYEHLTMRGALVRYATASAAVVAAALYLPVLGERLAVETGLGTAFVGALFIAITTSLPEIVVSITAVRMGALELGIANVLGSNLFNLLILGLDDLFYRPGPLLSAVDSTHLIAVIAVLMMNAVFLIGLTQQVLTKRFRIAWDGAALAIIYAAAVYLIYSLHS